MTKEVPNMTKVKRLTLDRYEHGLLVRALYVEWKKAGSRCEHNRNRGPDLEGHRRTNK